MRPIRLQSRGLLMNRGTALRRVKGLTLLIFAVSISAAEAQSSYKLPAGTRLSLTLDSELSSKVASVNDTFLATVSRPVRVNDTVILPAGAMVVGRVTTASPASLFGRGGTLRLSFESLKVVNGSRHIDGKLVPSIEPGHPFFLFAAFVKGREARLKKDEEFEIELKRDVVLPVVDY
jgi:hypothetical protein